MSKKKKPELTVNMVDEFYITPNEGWMWFLYNIHGTDIFGRSTYARKDSAKRGAIRALTKLGIAKKYDLVFMVVE